jgi:hypothetical protein
MIYSRREWLKAEWEYLLWKVGWKDYCLQCDEIFSWPRRKRHRDCRCAGLWML